MRLKHPGPDNSVLDQDVIWHRPDGPDGPDTLGGDRGEGFSPNANVDGGSAKQNNKAKSARAKSNGSGAGSPESRNTARAYPRAGRGRASRRIEP